jgi:hypothetical protein
MKKQILMVALLLSCVGLKANRIGREYADHTMLNLYHSQKMGQETAHRVMANVFFNIKQGKRIANRTLINEFKALKKDLHKTMAYRNLMRSLHNLEKTPEFKSLESIIKELKRNYHR